MKCTLASALLSLVLLSECVSAILPTVDQRNGANSHISPATAPARRNLKAKKHHSGKRACSASSAPVSTPVPTPTPTPTPSSTPSSSSAPPTQTGSGGGSSSGTIQSSFLCDGQPSGATVNTTATDGPNGMEDWLNCGLQPGGSGWNPPNITIDQLIVVDLATALQADNSPFHNCAAYLDFFNQFGSQYGVPPIFLASFAMQESSCNPDAQGEGGEQGLMQISPDKCTDAPGGNCKDPKYNIETATKYFADTLASNGNNPVISVGTYNGYYAGLTYDQATAAASSNCCYCQNNLDYLMQFFNGWILNIDPYSNNLGKYFNYNVCGGN